MKTRQKPTQDSVTYHSCTGGISANNQPAVGFSFNLRRAAHGIQILCMKFMQISHLPTQDRTATIKLHFTSSLIQKKPFWPCHSYGQFWWHWDAFASRLSVFLSWLNSLLCGFFVLSSADHHLQVMGDNLNLWGWLISPSIL